MIAYLEGTILSKGPDRLVIKTGGVGYEVRVPAGTLEKSPGVGSPVSLYTYLYLRQDLVQLYGFDSPVSRELFEKLMGVSGFGSQKALSVLSLFSPEGFEEIVRKGDVEALTMIPGVGKKSAQRLMLEMRDKIELEPVGMAGVPEESREASLEAVEALVQLGFTRIESQEALSGFGFDAGEVTVEKMIQFALKNMGSGGKG